MDGEREYMHLAQADQHIVELRDDIARQWQIIKELSQSRQPLHQAISMLTLLKDHLCIMERHRALILDEVQKSNSRAVLGLGSASMPVR
jgi:hypothetical protein